MAGSVVANPRVTVQLLPANIVQALDERRDLLVGQLGPSATATSGVVLDNIKQYSKSTLKSLLGQGELYQRALAFLGPNGGYSKVDVLGVSPAGGTTAAAAAGSLAITGTATAAGTLTISLVDAKIFTVTVSIPSGSTATAAGDLVAAAINALVDKVFTAVNTTGTVAITASDKGTVGNYWGIRVSGSVAGLAVVVTQFTGGATDPTVTGILDAIGSRRYTGISWPEYWDASKAEVVDLLEKRFNAANSIQDGVAFIGKSLTYANALSYSSGLNTQVLVAMGSGKVATGPACLRPADWVAAEFMGIRARRLTTGAPIADYIVATSGPLDAFGGGHTASLPYFNTPLNDTPLSNITDGYADTEQLDLINSGFTVYGVSPSEADVVMGQVVTTYKTDAAGNENVSFKYLNYVDTGSVCREVFFRVLRSTFSQSRLTDGDLIPGLNMANAGSIRATLSSIYRTLANAGLVQAGRNAEAAFISNTQVSVNLSTGTATISGPLYIVTQLRTINYALQFSFAVGQTGTQINL